MKDAGARMEISARKMEPDYIVAFDGEKFCCAGTERRFAAAWGILFWALIAYYWLEIKKDVARALHVMHGNSVAAIDSAFSASPHAAGDDSTEREVRRESTTLQMDDIASDLADSRAPVSAL